MDKLKAMQTFIHIADAGSLTAAARTMNSSLPAVVRSLAALEASLAARLFNRSTRRIALTEEGREYLYQCRDILTAVTEAEASLLAAIEEPSGLLTITTSIAIGEIMLAPLLNQWVQRYPKVRCNLLLLDRVVNLVEEGIDVGLRIGELQDSTLVAQQLGSIRRVLVASPSFVATHTAQFGELEHPKDLLKANCIGFSGATSSWWSFYENNKQFTLPIKGNLGFNHITPALNACVNGMGFGIFILPQVSPYIAAGQLTLLLENFEPPPRPLNLIYPHSRLLPARTRAFIEMVKQANLTA